MASSTNLAVETDFDKQKEDQDSVRKQHLSKCIGIWEDQCKKLQIAFMAQKDSGANEPRGGTCKHLDLSGASLKAMTWRKALLSNLHVSHKEAEISMHQTLKDIPLSEA
jgi:hypothetical protein